MDYADFVKGISFRFLQPGTPRPTGLRAVAKVLRQVGVHLEVMNTQLPEKQAELRERLKDVCKIPRMSTFAIGAMINEAVARLPQGQCYLNVGVWNGFTYFSGLAGNGGKLCIGVDNFSHKNFPQKAFLERFERFHGEGHSFVESDFREYFQRAEHPPIGFYLFDGPHTYADQWDGLNLAEPFFADDCVVMVDDCNWEQVRNANLDFIARSPNTYEMLLDVKTPKSGHPTFWNGIMVFRMKGKNVARKVAAAKRAA